MHPRRLHYDVCFLLFQENTDSLAEQPHGAFPRKVSAGCYMKVELYQRHRLHRKLDFVFDTQGLILRETGIDMLEKELSLLYNKITVRVQI